MQRKKCSISTRDCHIWKHTQVQSYSEQLRHLPTCDMVFINLTINFSWTHGSMNIGFVITTMMQHKCHLVMTTSTLPVPRKFIRYWFQGWWVIRINCQRQSVFNSVFCSQSNNDKVQKLTLGNHSISVHCGNILTFTSVLQITNLRPP